jgi:hypothetical protein
MLLHRATEWFRTRAACYGAVIAIILEQLNAAPTTTVVEDPNPLVRIEPSSRDVAGWHPDELIQRSGGGSWVVVWSQSTDESASASPLMSAN